MQTIQSIDIDQLSTVTGGAGKWDSIRTAAQPHCPETVARFTKAPTSRGQAQRIGNACLAEMGSFKAAMGGRAKIQAGIDDAFPK